LAERGTDDLKEVADHQIRGPEGEEIGEAVET